MKKLLFVCLGNICRSPMAEAIMKKIISDAKLEKHYFCDSAGTNGYHDGEKADLRMRKIGAKHGYNVDSISRKITKKDLVEFDYIFAVDLQNYQYLKSMSSSDEQNKIFELCKFANISSKYVPDPYYGDDADFEEVIRILEEACKIVLAKLQEK